MTRKSLSILSVVVGVTLTVFFGSAIARRTGFGAETWLMSAFALGIVLVCQEPVLRLEHQVREMQTKMDASDA